MKKNKLVNVILIMIVCLSVVFLTRETLAANVIDITNSITGNNTTTGNTTTGNNTANTNNIVGGNNTTSVNNAVLTTNNTTSNYNNTSLPKTGITDSISGIVLVVILIISAIYAYNKIKYYKNI